jgi:hypothetical protein
MTTPTKLPIGPYSNRGAAEYKRIKTFSAQTVDPGSLTTYTGTTGTLTVAGAALGDPVDVTFSLDLQAQMLTGYVNDGDSVTWVLFNSTAGTINLASGTMYVTVYYKTEGIDIGIG